MARRAALSILFALILTVGANSLPLAGATPYPVLPIATGLRFLTNLSVPSLDPGGSEMIQATVENPLSAAINATALTLEVYAFNPFGSDSPTPTAAGSSPIFEGLGTSGPSALLTIGTLAPGVSFELPRDHSVSISIPSETASGTYAIRAALSFHQGSQSYLLESRGYFSNSAWANATILANGTPTLDLSRLGVSGVLPETAVFVRGASLAPWIYGLLGGALVLAGAGGYLAWRRLPKSRSGARRPLEPQSAATAFGTSRRRDGD